MNRPSRQILESSVNGRRHHSATGDQSHIGLLIYEMACFHDPFDANIGFPGTSRYETGGSNHGPGGCKGISGGTEERPTVRWPMMRIDGCEAILMRPRRLELGTILNNCSV